MSKGSSASGARGRAERAICHQSTTPTPHCDYGFFSDARPLKSIIVRSDAEDPVELFYWLLAGVATRWRPDVLRRRTRVIRRRAKRPAKHRARAEAGTSGINVLSNRPTANKTRRRRGLNGMNFSSVQFRNAEFLWRLLCGFCTFCISFASRSTLCIIMSPGADPDLDVLPGT